MSDSEQDKKRNKLGYQRISIACAHCRRRKIRCLLADNDPAGRCQNCIRLKKDCIFHPIDQPGECDSGSQSRRREVGSVSFFGSSSTSPEIHAAADHGTGRSHFPPFAHTSAQNLQGLPLEQGGAFSGHYLSAARSDQGTLPSNAPWPLEVSRDYEMQMQGRTMSPAHSKQPQYWMYDQSPPSGDFAPFPDDSAQQVRTPTTFHSTYGLQPSPDQQWRLQQPHQSSQPMIYALHASAMAHGLPRSVPPYASDASQHLLSASYPPASVPLENGHMMNQMQGPPFSTSIPQSHSFTERTGGATNGLAGPQSDHQHAAVPVQQGYPMTWGSSAGPGVSADEEHNIPSSAPPAQYVLPSQRLG